MMGVDVGSAVAVRPTAVGVRVGIAGVGVVVVVDDGCDVGVTVTVRTTDGVGVAVRVGRRRKKSTTLLSPSDVAGRPNPEPPNRTTKATTISTIRTSAARQSERVLFMGLLLS